ncbi:MAG: hypothetical protein PUB66_05745 [Oscillospiraceae bacterium]|nr:hypothetical protein [Ruminococcus sp.]MDD6098213.1 hypothetical protein [Oscillospiraceae bacterium]
MKCPKCGGTNCVVMPVTETKTKYRGCCGWLLWIILALLTCGLILIIPLVTNKKTKTKTKTVAVCQDCGTKWNV